MTAPLLAESWLMNLDGAGAAPGTLRAYRSALIDLAAHLGPTDFLDASKDDLRRWVIAMRDGSPTRRGLAPNTVRQRVKIVKSFYRWLTAEGDLTGADPSQAIRAPAEVRPDVVTVTPAQAKALLSSCAGPGFENRRNTAILSVLLDGGLRRAECAGLLVEDVDLRAGTVHVVGKGAKLRGARHRAASIGVHTRAAIDRYLRVRPQVAGSADMAALWLSRRTGGPITDAVIRRVVEHAGTRAGLTLHAHVLRHTWASEFRDSGGNEGDLMTLGGWTNRRELDRYGRADARNRALHAGHRHSLGDRLR